MFLKFQFFTQGLGQTMNVGDWENVEALRQEILNLLGIKHVPSKKAPHFYSHLGNKTVIRKSPQLLHHLYVD